jgi:hypothetical protein
MTLDGIPRLAELVAELDAARLELDCAGLGVAEANAALEMAVCRMNAALLRHDHAVTIYRTHRTQAGLGAEHL